LGRNWAIAGGEKGIAIAIVLGGPTDDTYMFFARYHGTNILGTAIEIGLGWACFVKGVLYEEHYRGWTLLDQPSTIYDAFVHPVLNRFCF
jgi:hypothetical protein